MQTEKIQIAWSGLCETGVLRRVFRDFNYLANFVAKRLRFLGHKSMTSHESHASFLSNWEEKVFYIRPFNSRATKMQSRSRDIAIYPYIKCGVTSLSCVIQCKIIVDKIYHCQWSCAPIRQTGTNGRGSFLCHIPRMSPFIRHVITACSTSASKLHCWFRAIINLFVANGFRILLT